MTAIKDLLHQAKCTLSSHRVDERSVYCVCCKVLWPCDANRMAQAVIDKVTEFGRQLQRAAL